MSPVRIAFACRSRRLAGARGLRRRGDRAGRGQRDRRRRRASSIRTAPRSTPPSAFLTEAVAQGLVRFNAEGDIEPALAQSWIISDDGLHLHLPAPPDQLDRRRPGHRRAGRGAAARGRWPATSRNPLKPVLGAVTEIVAMTDEVIVDQPARAAPQFPAAARPAGTRLDPRAAPAPAPTGSPVPSERRDAAAARRAARTRKRRPASPDILLRGEPAVARRRPLRRRAARSRARRHGRRPRFRPRRRSAEQRPPVRSGPAACSACPSIRAVDL